MVIKLCHVCTRKIMTDSLICGMYDISRNSEKTVASYSQNVCVFLIADSAKKDYMVTKRWTWHGRIQIIIRIYFSKASIYSPSTYCPLNSWQGWYNSLASNSSNLCSVRSFTGPWRKWTVEGSYSLIWTLH